MRLHHAEADEQPAEQQDFRRQEQPHADLAGVELLLHGGEVVLQDTVVLTVRIVLPAVYSCGCTSFSAANRLAVIVRPVRHDRASRRSCASMGGDASATRGSSRPTGWRGASCGLRSEAQQVDRSVRNKPAPRIQEPNVENTCSGWNWSR